MAEPIQDGDAFYIGIDPDSDKSGVARWWTYSKKYSLHNFAFFELYAYLEKNKQNLRLVVIEAGWLNRSVWHGAYGKKAPVAARIGNNVGCNHETGRKIEEMCKHLNIFYELVKPTRSKLSDKEFRNITGIKERTNQEQRDAFMLVFGR